MQAIDIAPFDYATTASTVLLVAQESIVRIGFP